MRIAIMNRRSLLALLHWRRGRGEEAAVGSHSVHAKPQISMRKKISLLTSDATICYLQLVHQISFKIKVASRRKADKFTPT
jgi:hypothetical protein